MSISEADVIVNPVFDKSRPTRFVILGELTGRANKEMAKRVLEAAGAKRRRQGVGRDRLPRARRQGSAGRAGAHRVRGLQAGAGVGHRDHPRARPRSVPDVLRPEPERGRSVHVRGGARTARTFFWWERIAKPGRWCRAERSPSACIDRPSSAVRGESTADTAAGHSLRPRCRGIGSSALRAA